MKALVWTGPEKLEFSNVPDPELFPGWVLLKVKSIGICGSELSGYLGQNSLRRPPLIMGHEFSGVIVETSENVSEELLGNLVTVNPLISCGICNACLNGNQQLCRKRKVIGIDLPGAFAEYVSVPLKQCFPITNSLEGGVVEPLACSLRAVNQSQIDLGDVAIVIGAGIIGLMTIKLLKSRGAHKIIALDTNSTRLKATKKWGADYLFNPKEVDVLNEINSLYPEGVDRVMDAVGFSETRTQAVSTLRRGGRAVFIGLHENDTSLAGNDIVRNEIEISGTFCYSDDEFTRAVDLVEDGFIDFADKSWYDIRPLEDGDKAFQEQINGTADFSKIILVPEKTT